MTGFLQAGGDDTDGERRFREDAPPPGSGSGSGANEALSRGGTPRVASARQAAEVVERLRGDGVTLAVAESCTGGLLGGALTDVPGASHVFRGGVIAYADAVKEGLLGVDPALFTDGHGAVSAAVVEAMAHGVRRRFGTDVAVSTSGIAGPGGGSREKPVGTVWVAVVGPGDLVAAHRLQLVGDRGAVRAETVEAALRFLDEALDEAERERLLTNR